MYKTRVKITTDCNSVSYQCQYEVKWFFNLLSQWYDMNVNISKPAVFPTIEQAQAHIDVWIVRQAEMLEATKLMIDKKLTKTITYVDYP